MTNESYSRLRDAIREVYKNCKQIQGLLMELLVIKEDHKKLIFEALMWSLYNLAVDKKLLDKNNFSAFANEEEIWIALKSIAKELKIDLSWMSQN